MATNPDTPRITLHWLELSRSQRTMWLLEELGVPYELETYKRTRDSLAPPELKAVHPLGKSPVVTIEYSASTEPVVLAESAFIVEYLCDYYGKHLLPTRYAEGKDGQIGGETESWLRYRFLMHYAEGSLMPLILISLLFSKLKSSAPFFIRPIVNAIASKVVSLFLKPNFETHYKFLEGQLASSPDGGEYLCGKDFSAADIMMWFPLEAGQTYSGMSKEQFPKLWAYVSRLSETQSYKRSVQKIEELEGGFQTKL